MAQQHDTSAQANRGAGWAQAIASLGAIAGTLLVNTLSNLYPPGGQNVGEIANTVLAGVKITPANYAFAIWGLIYLGLIAYGVYQLGPAQRRDRTLRRVNVLLIVACLSQMGWIFLFTTQAFAGSIVAMLGILLPLIGIDQVLGRSAKPAHRARRWYVRYPFSLYLGWIAVATVVNVASALYAAGWGGWGIGPVGWTVLMVLVSGAIAAIVTWQHADIPFVLVFVWAWVAIAVRNTATPAIQVAALGVAVITLGLLGWRRWR